MKISVHNIKGKETSKKVDLDKNIFAISPNDHAIYLDVKQHLATKRSGTHKSKERSEIKGSRRKLRKQKGSGAARVGDIKNPIFRGGGRVFGPRPRNYSFKVNKKVKRLARKSALSYMAKDQNIIVLENFNIDTPKTKTYKQILSSFDLLNCKSLLVLAENNQNIVLSSRNLTNTKVILANELNTYDVMNASKLIITESSMEIIKNNFKS
tara:strand:- start:1793 stop:2422 length:630 start_codon:yes stop_codon:yes gene_type:complete